MKRIIFAVLLCALMLASCGGKSEDVTSEVTTPDTTAEAVEETTEVTTAAETTAETAVPETTAPETTAAEIPADTDFDFQTARIMDCKIVNVGEEFELSWDGTGFVSSHPSVCTVDGKKATALKKGVTLMGKYGSDEAYAICVLPEGGFVDPTAGEPRLLEVGRNEFVEGFSSAEHSSSDPEVASLSGSTVTAISPGYALIDMSNISMPKLFSFVVFDRNTD